MIMAAEMFVRLWRDLVYACRSLAKARAFTFVCVVSLGIGMTPVIAVPYWMRIFVTPPLGVDTDGLVEVVTTRVGSRGETDEWSYPDFVDLRDAPTGVSMTGWAIGDSEVTLQISGDVGTTSPTMFVSANYFETIGVALARGPGFQGQSDPAVIIGHSFWRHRLGADPDIVGKTLTLNRISHLVVGIAPDQFAGHLGFHDADLFVPLERHPTVLAADSVRFDRSREWVRIHGRLSPGVSVVQASAAVSAVTSELARQHQPTNEFKAGVVEPYHASGVLEGADMRIIRAAWQAIAMLPLLVVCLNIAGMVQVRGAIRERELSIRQAIGASRGRLIQYLLTEALVLAALGAALASLVIFNIPPLMSSWVGEPIPAHWQQALRLDLEMIAICLATCLATSLLFGWLPAIRFSRPVIITVLKDDAGGGGRRAGRVHRLTAALQAAIAVPLLVLSGISLDRVRTTATADLGFEADLLYAAPLNSHAASQVRNVSETLAKASGVAAVTVADGLPLDFRYRITRVSVDGDAGAAPTVASAHVTRVGEGYLDTMGISLVRGRGFTTDDGAGAEMVTVVSHALAQQLFPETDPADALGRRLTFGAPDQARPQQTLTIVGVTADFPTSQMSTDRAQLLLPLAQHVDVRRDSVAVSDDGSGRPQVMVVARSLPGEPPGKVPAALESVIRQVDPDFKPASIVTGVWLRQNSRDDFLNQSAFAGISGGVILMLAALGIYGVVGLMVTTRTREIAVRVTLGASRPRVIGMIVFDVVKLVAPGVAVGLLIAAAIVRVDGGSLGIPLSRTEPLAYMVAAAIAILVSIVAGLAPARRAASVQPMVAMRSE